MVNIKQKKTNNRRTKHNVKKPQTQSPRIEGKGLGFSYHILFYITYCPTGDTKLIPESRVTGIPGGAR